MVVSEVIESLRNEIRRNLIERDLGENPDEQRWLAPQDLAPKTLAPQLLSLFSQLSVNDSMPQEREHLRNFCKVLLILLEMDCTLEDLQIFQRRALRNDSIRDEHLPVKRAKLIHQFGEDLGTHFHRKQFIFCPVILRDGKEQSYLGELDQHCPLPFENREELGSGSSGKVYKVRIIAGHLYPDADGMGPNDKPLLFAWKEFTRCGNPKDAYRTERENLEIIRNSADVRSEHNIMLARGSLLRGTTYSLLFDLADCDLKQYLSDSSTAIPESAEEVKSYLCRFKGLVTALNFLHNNLVSRDTEESLCFAHLDLKPANILVFNKGIFDRALGSEKLEIWKIHDFGVSRIKIASPPARTVFKWLLPGPPEDQVSPSTRNWPEGTFYAPETQPGIGKKVTGLKPASDIWSLGCILSLVISFIDKGPRSIQQFEEKRQSTTKSTKDPFYVKKGNKFLLNKGVTEWFTILEKRIEERIKDDPKSVLSLVVRDTTSLLKKCFLVVNPDKRADSKQIATAFQGILLRFDQPGPRNRTVDMLYDRFRDWSSVGMKDPTKPPETFQLDNMPEAPSSCKYSLRGDHLAFLSGQEIVSYNVVGVLCKNANRVPQSRKPVDSATWGGFDLCSKYLVAFTKHAHLDIYLYQNSPPRQVYPTQYRSHFFHNHLPQIRKISLSSNGQHFVMALRRNYEPYKIYLCRVEDIQKASEDLESMQPPWRPHLLNPVDPRTNTEIVIQHIESIQFSEDSKLFTLLSQPIGTNTHTFYGWSWNSRRNKYTYVNSITFNSTGQVDTDQTWITAFIPLMPQLSVLRVTLQQVLSQSGFTAKSKELDWKSQELNNVQILDVLPLAETDRHCIFIGREKRKRGTIKALYAEVRSLKNKLEEVHFDYVLDLECSEWVPGRDSASTLSDGEIFLVSKGEGSGFIREVFRPRAQNV